MSLPIQSPRPRGAVVFALGLALSLAPAPALQAQAPATGTIPHPDEVVGFELGADYMLADLGQLYAYYEALAEASPRVKLTEIGTSVRGEPLLLLFISSEENLEQLDRWRSIAERLARARDLGQDEARELAREGKAIVWIDSGLHSAEVAHAQHAPLLAYHMATDESEESRRIRDDVILLLMPQMNPDGHEIVVDWYRRVARTDHEFQGPPEVWHEYVGHDINRDWFMIRQQETRNISRVLYEEWYPQIVLNHHQHSPFPTRIFIPPFSDPLNPHIHPLVVRGVNMVGEAMAKRFEERGMSGVVSGLTFTMWWNGGMRTAPYFHNMVGILTEVAHRSATPVYHDPDDLPREIQAGSRTLSMVEPSIWYANPWEGGWARLRDAMEYHLQSSIATLDIGSRLKEDWLFNIYRMGRAQIERGEAGGPFAYVVDLEDQWDRGEAVELLNVLRRGGVEVHRAAASFRAEGRTYPAGTYIAFAGQAFRPHLVDLMERHEHPHREIYPGGPPEPPYGGLAGWTLPMQMGVNVARIEEPFQARAEPVDVVPVPEHRTAGSGDWGFALSEKRSASRIAVNRLLEAGDRVHVAGNGFRAGDRELRPGAFVVEAGAGTRDRVMETARELGLQVTALDRQPDGDLHALRAPRLGVYMPWTGNMDEGWTRFLLDAHEFQRDTLRNEDIRGDLSGYDVILFADQNPNSILNGHRPGSMPDEFVGGVGEQGAENLRRWVEAGGTLITFDGASDFAIHALDLPVANATAELSREELFIPGSLIRTRMDHSHPVAFGMREEQAVFYQNSRGFTVDDPSTVDVVARYAEADLLMSGWEVGAEEHLAGLAAAVRARVGLGEAILIGFRPQFRTQPSGTFKLIFNAIHGAGVEGDGLRTARGEGAGAATGAR